MRLGALSSAKHDPVRFALAPRLKDYGSLPLMADTCDYGRCMTRPWGVMANDRVGDCVLAGYWHHVQACTVNVAGATLEVTDQRVLNDYTAVTGYDPERPETDVVTVPLEAWRFKARKGELLGFALVDPLDDAHVCAAVQLFGGCVASYDLPERWKTDTTWGVTDRDAPLAGGHLVYHCGHDRRGNLATVTWGDVRVLTPDARRQRCSEMWVIIDEAWMDSRGKTIQGLDLGGLVDAAKLVF